MRFYSESTNPAEVLRELVTQALEYAVNVEDRLNQARESIPRLEEELEEAEASVEQLRGALSVLWKEGYRL